MKFRYILSMLIVVFASFFAAYVFGEDTPTDPITTTSSPNSADNPTKTSGSPTSPSSTTTSPINTKTPLTAPTDTKPHDTPTSPTPDTPTAPPATNSSTPSFQKVCVDTWVEKNKDNAEFKTFGEKYCRCAETQQPLDTTEAINKAIEVCMSRTLLQDSMDKLSVDIGLDKVTVDNIGEFCINKWKLIYPKMDDKDTDAAKAYCECSKPKLFALTQKAKEMTSQGLIEAINGVAASCSGHVGK